MDTLQQQIIHQMQVKPTIDCKWELEQRKNIVKRALKERGFKKVVLGISGGQDSTLMGKILRITIDELKQEENDNEYSFIAMRLPYGIQADEDDCTLALEYVKPDETITYNIKEVVDKHVEILNQKNVEVNDHHKGNLKARERMVAQYLVAGINDAIVVGTDHAAEAIMGFFTKFGDAGADVIPLYGLNKRQGKKLCQYLDCPERLYKKTPTADLEDSRPQIPDEEALGVSYEAIDDYLEGKDVKQRDRQVIEYWYRRNIHKRAMPRTIGDVF